MLKITQTKAGDITIRIPRAALRHTVRTLDLYDGDARVTNTKVFSDAVILELEREEDDGTTLAHLMIDRAVERAIESGAEGVKIDGDDY
jgi:pyruvate carboxylase